jgi:hypothetical protein
MPSKKTQRLTVDIPAELHRRAKVYAAREGKELRAVVEAALRLWLSRGERRPPRPSVRQMDPGEFGRLRPLRKKGERDAR